MRNVTVRHRVVQRAFRILLVSLLSALGPVSCSSAVAVRPPAVSRPQPELRTSSLERSIHDLINKERRKQGLPSLAWDDRLARIARGHSADMALRDYFSHDSPEGNGFPYRYRQAGYTCALRVGTTVYGGAENIFQNNRYDSITTINGREYYDWNPERKIAETTVQGWMDSRGHRRNILTPHWEREGIGVHLSPDNKIYITQNFC